MFIKRKKIKLVLITIVLLIICTSIGVLKHRESTFATRTIDGLVDIGEFSLQVNCYGKGRPTVIFEAGLGCTNLDWALVQPEISKIARTFSYDRLNRVSLPADKLPRTSLDQVHELHALLNKAKVKGPYIIVAHSIGGYNARLFAGTYPKEVSGIVFVDSSHENQNDNLSPEVLAESKKGLATAELNFDELVLSGKQVKEIRKKDALRNIPIVVLAADHNDVNSDSSKIWLNFQKDLTSLSDHGKYVLVENSGHFIQNDKPQVVIDAIKELITTARK